MGCRAPRGGGGTRSGSLVSRCSRLGKGKPASPARPQTSKNTAPPQSNQRQDLMNRLIRAEAHRYEAHIMVHERRPPAHKLYDMGPEGCHEYSRSLIGPRRVPRRPSLSTLLGRPQQAWAAGRLYILAVDVDLAQ